ncbi:zinc finger, CCHC-type containing protein [Tanacetum coccineum]
MIQALLMLPVSEDINSLLHFSMSEAFTNPLKLLHSENLARDEDETTEINHRSHPDHPLILKVEEAQSNSIIPNFNSREPIEFPNFVPKKYLPIVAPIEQYYDLETMSFEEAVGRVKAYEERLQSLEAKDEEQGKLMLASEQTYGENSRRKRNFKRGERGRGRGRSDKSGFRCYECGKFGHFSYECTNWKDKDDNKEANLIQKDEPTFL